MTFARTQALGTMANWLYSRSMIATVPAIERRLNARGDMYRALMTLADDVPSQAVPPPTELSDLNECGKIEGRDGFLFLSFKGEIGAFSNAVDPMLAKIATANEIQVGICSTGGSIEKSLKLFSALSAAAARGVRVEVTIHGYALSAACLIAQAGTVRKIGADGYVMCHPPQTFCAGSVSILKSEVQRLETITEKLIEIFTLRTGMSAACVRDWFTGKDRYWNATEAKFLNLVDEVVCAEAPRAIDPFHPSPAGCEKSGRD